MVKASNATDLDNPRLSYAILLYKEKETFIKLMNQLYSHPHSFEVRVVMDGDNPEILELLETYQTTKDNFHYVRRPLNKNFSAQRNYIGSLCRGDYIVRIDADELMPDEILLGINDYLKFFDKQGYDSIWLPRINYTGQASEKLIKRHKMKIDERGWEGFPDFQLKLYRNFPYLTWINTVHERLTGVKNEYYFPAEEKYAIWHNKPAESRAASNEFYRTFRMRYFEKLRKSFEKRIKLLWNKN